MKGREPHRISFLASTALGIRKRTTHQAPPQLAIATRSWKPAANSRQFTAVLNNNTKLQKKTSVSFCLCCQLSLCRLLLFPPYSGSAAAMAKRLGNVQQCVNLFCFMHFQFVKFVFWRYSTICVLVYRKSKVSHHTPAALRNLYK